MGIKDVRNALKRKNQGEPMKDKLLYIRISTDSYDKITRAARADSRTKSDWIRKVLEDRINE